MPLAATPSDAASAALSRVQRITSRQNEDGTWNLFGVFCFGEVPAGAKGKGAPGVDREWLEKALSRSQQFARTGYSAPLVLRHTVRRDGSLEPEQKRAGSFVLRDIVDGEVTANGVSGAVLRADFLRVSPEAYFRIKSGEFPSVSVEVGSFKDPSIAKIALLDTDEPFFRYPSITIGREISADETRSISSFRAEDDDDSRLRGCLHVGDSYAYLFRASIEVDEEKDADTAPACPHCKKRLEKDDEGNDQDDQAGGDVAPVTPQEISQMSDTNTDQVPQTNEQLEAVLTQFADVSARLTALEQRDRERAKSDEAAARFAAAEKALEGYSIDEATRDEIRQFADSMPEAQFNRYVEGLKRLLPSEVDTLDDLVRRSAPDGELPKDLPAEVSAFRAEGPATFEAAVACFRDFQEAKKRRTILGDVSVKQFLDDNLEFYVRKGAGSR